MQHEHARSTRSLPNRRMIDFLFGWRSATPLSFSDEHLIFKAIQITHCLHAFLCNAPQTGDFHGDAANGPIMKCVGVENRGHMEEQSGVRQHREVKLLFYDVVLYYDGADSITVERSRENPLHYYCMKKPPYPSRENKTSRHDPPF